MPKLVYTGLWNFIFRLNNRWETIVFSENNKYTVDVDRDTAYKILRDKSKGIDVRFKQDPKAKKKKATLGHRNKIHTWNQDEQIVRVKMWSNTGSIWIKRLVAFTKKEIDAQGYDWDHAKMHAELVKKDEIPAWIVDNELLKELKAKEEKKVAETAEAKKKEEERNKKNNKDDKKDDGKNNDSKSSWSKVKQVFNLDSNVDVKTNLS